MSKPGDRKADILVGVPTYDGTLNYRFMLCLERMILHLQSKGLVLARSIQQGSSIPFNRADIVHKARMYNAKKILFVDADMVFEPDVGYKLWEHRKGAVSGLYFAKQPPFGAIAYTKKEDGTYDNFKQKHSEALHEVDAVGFGMFMVETKYFSDDVTPWFQMTEFHGEDQYACEMIKKKGGRIYLDASLKLGHLGMDCYTDKDCQYYEEPDSKSLSHSLKESIVEEGKKKVLADIKKE